MIKKFESPSVNIFKSKDGRVALDVELDNDSVWLTREQLSKLFDRTRTVIGRHIRNIFKENELEESSVCAKFAHTAADGKTYSVQCYSLDVIISVGYRVKSNRGVEFRQWASNVLKRLLGLLLTVS